MVFVERFYPVVLPESPECIDEMGAEVGVDILRSELGSSLPIHGPVGVVTHDNFVLGKRLLSFCPYV